MARDYERGYDRDEFRSCQCECHRGEGRRCGGFDRFEEDGFEDGCMRCHGPRGLRGFDFDGEDTYEREEDRGYDFDREEDCDCDRECCREREHHDRDCCDRERDRFDRFERFDRFDRCERDFDRFDDRCERDCGDVECVRHFHHHHKGLQSYLYMYHVGKETVCPGEAIHFGPVSVPCKPHGAIRKEGNKCVRICEPGVYEAVIHVQGLHDMNTCELRCNNKMICGSRFFNHTSGTAVDGTCLFEVKKCDLPARITLNNASCKPLHLECMGAFDVSAALTILQVSEKCEERRERCEERRECCDR